MIHQEGPDSTPGNELDWEFGKTAKLPSGGINGPDNLLAGSTPQAVTNVEVVISAFRSLLSSISYVSMPIASGKRLYDAMERHGVRNKQELVAKDPEALGREVIAPNVADGDVFSKAVMSRSAYPVLVPGIFESRGQRWAETEYMALWLTVLEGKAREIHMINDWEYSNGGVEEFVRGMEMRAGLSRIENNSDVRIYDHSGAELSLNSGALLIFKALSDLSKRGFAAPRLQTALQKLAEVGAHCDADGSAANRFGPDFDFQALLSYRNTGPA